MNVRFLVSFLLRLIPFLVLGLFRAAVLYAAPASDALFEVGTAKIEITPEYPIRLTGYVARKTESQLPGLKLWAKALAIGSDKEGPAILITVDNCGVCANVTEEVAARLQRRAGIARDHFAVSSSHTHSGPQTDGFAPNIFAMDLPLSQQQTITRYTKELTDKLEQVALTALKDRKSARLFWSESKVGFAANRRTRDGVAAAEGLRDVHDRTGRQCDRGARRNLDRRALALQLE